MSRDFAIHVDTANFELVLTIDGEEKEHRFLGTDAMLEYLRAEIQEERYKPALARILAPGYKQPSIAKRKDEVGQ